MRPGRCQRLTCVRDLSCKANLQILVSPFTVFGKRMVLPGCSQTWSSASPGIRPRSEVVCVDKSKMYACIDSRNELGSKLATNK